MIDSKTAMFQKMIVAIPLMSYMYKCYDTLINFKMHTVKFSAFHKKPLQCIKKEVSLLY